MYGALLWFILLAVGVGAYSMWTIISHIFWIVQGSKVILMLFKYLTLHIHKLHDSLHLLESNVAKTGIFF
jgi:uncharacterized membrane protein